MVLESVGKKGPLVNNTALSLALRISPLKLIFRDVDILEREWIRKHHFIK